MATPSHSQRSQVKEYNLFQCTFLTKCIQIRNISPFLIRPSVRTGAPSPRGKVLRGPHPCKHPFSGVPTFPNHPRRGYHNYLISHICAPTRSTLFPFSFFHFLYAFYLTQGQKWGIVSGGGGRCAFVLILCAPFRGCGDQNAAELPCDVNMPPLTGCMSGKMSNSLQKPRNEGGIFQSGVPYAGKNQGPLR